MKTHTFDSKFVNSELKTKIDTVTMTNFNEVKEELASFIKNNFKTGDRDIARLQTKNSPRQLQKFFYDYILVSTGDKVI